MSLFSTSDSVSTDFTSIVGIDVDTKTDFYAPTVISNTSETNFSSRSNIKDSVVGSLVNSLNSSLNQPIAIVGAGAGDMGKGLLESDFFKAPSSTQSAPPVTLWVSMILIGIAAFIIFRIAGKR